MINPAAPGKTFEFFWAELSTILRPGSQVGKFYGKAFTISAITILSVEIDSPDVGGVVELPKDAFRAIYADWRNYRYEKLAHTNPQETLHVISITEHVIQTWVRHENRMKLIELARADDLRDGVFRVRHLPCNEASADSKVPPNMNEGTRLPQALVSLAYERRDRSLGITELLRGQPDGALRCLRRNPESPALLTGEISMVKERAGTQTLGLSGEKDGRALRNVRARTI